MVTSRAGVRRGARLRLRGRVGRRAEGHERQPDAGHAADQRAQRQQIARGRTLFLDGCSSCHGNDARGKQNIAPTLVGAGEAAADFYLTTGRMPLSNPTDEPHARAPRLLRHDIDALVAYVGSLGQGPSDPEGRRRDGERSTNGLASFTLHCAGCHQVGAAGGIVTGAIAPPLNESDITPTAGRRGDPRRPLPHAELQRRTSSPTRTLDDIARYVQLDDAPRRRRRLGHRPHRPDPRRHDRLVPGASRRCS